MRFLPFGFFHAVGHDAAAALHIQRAVFNHGGADGDGQIHVVVERPHADGAAVDIALFGFQLFNDFQRAHFGRTGQCAGGERGGEDVHIADFGLQAAFHVGNDVHDVRIFFHHHFFGDGHTAGPADAADIVAAQVNQHGVFGNFFFVGQQIAFVRRVLFGRGAAQPRAGNGADDDFVALAAHQDFRRRADDVEIAEIVVKQIGRRVERAQGAV